MRPSRWRPGQAEAATEMAGGEGETVTARHPSSSHFSAHTAPFCELTEGIAGERACLAPKWACPVTKTPGTSRIPIS